MALAREVAEAEGLAVQIKAYPGETDTDADELMAAGTAATLTIGLPMRYMHSPFEVARLDDLEAAARLVAALARRVGAANRQGLTMTQREAPVKLFIAIDLEGICGVVSEADTAREGAAAQRARAHMRADLDAVLEGCAAAGAEQVVVCDAHDDGRNLDPAGSARLRHAGRAARRRPAACSRAWPRTATARSSSATTGARAPSPPCSSTRGTTRSSR